MPDVFRELFAFAGADFDARLSMVKMEPNYRVRFGDGTSLDVSSDLARMVPQLEAMEPGVAPRYYAFLRDSGLKVQIWPLRVRGEEFPQGFGLFYRAESASAEYAGRDKSCTHMCRATSATRVCARFFDAEHVPGHLPL